MVLNFLHSMQFSLLDRCRFVLNMSRRSVRRSHLRRRRRKSERCGWIVRDEQDISTFAGLSAGLSALFSSPWPFHTSLLKPNLKNAAKVWRCKWEDDAAERLQHNKIFTPFVSY